MRTLVMRRTTIPAAVVLAGLLALALAAFAPSTAYAGDMPVSGGAKWYDVKKGKVCKKVDLTGNKKKDAVSYKLKSKKLTVYVNGKKKLSLSNVKYLTYVSLFKLKNGKAFLTVCYDDKKGAPGGGVYQYKSGKLKRVINFASVAAVAKKQMNAKPKYFECGMSKVSKNSVEVYCRATGDDPWDSVLVDQKYTYKSKTLKKVSQKVIKDR